MKRNVISRVLLQHLAHGLGVFLCVLSIISILISCGSDDASNSNGSVGWVTITEPSDSTSYTAENIDTIRISGKMFQSPSGGTISGTQCGCSNIAICWPFICWDYSYFAFALTVTVTNHSTGFSIEVDRADLTVPDAWSVEIPLVYGENLIEVYVEDLKGISAREQILIEVEDTILPAVLSTIPENNSVANVDNITIYFSEAMDTSTITNTSILVSDGNNNIPGVISFNNDNTAATFSPLADLSHDMKYTVTLNNTIQDLFANKLTTTTWSFMTFVEMWRFGSTGLDEGYGICIDANGNSYVSGATNGDLAGVGNAGEYDVFITKFDSLGNTQWMKQFGTTGFDGGRGVSVDEQGNAYITGFIGGEPFNAGTYDIFVAKYDNAGNQQWIKQLGTLASVDFGRGVGIDENENIYITGDTDGDLGGVGNVGSSDIIIAKYDAAGNQQWLRQFGTNSSERAYGIAVDKNGNSYVTGYTFGDFTNSGSPSGSDGFIAKYDTAGNQLWVRQFGSNEYYNESNGISVDENGNSYVTGFTSGDLAGTGNAGASDAYIVKYDNSGNQLWAKQFGSVYDDEGNDIIVDASENVYVIGYTRGDLDPIGDDGGDDVFLAKYDAAGSQYWVKQFGTSSKDVGNSITVDMNGVIYTTGQVSGGVFISRHYP